MSIRFRCKNCNQKYELEDQLAGQVSECLRCGAAMMIPGETQIAADNSALKSRIIKRATPVQGLNVLDKIPKVKIVSCTAKNGAEDDIIFCCKICQQKYRLARELAGQVAECAKCKANMVIPVKSDTWSRNAAKPAGKVVFWCKACGAKYRLDKELVGQLVECTRCRSSFPIPGESETAPPQKLAGQNPAVSQTVMPQPSSLQDKVEQPVQLTSSMDVSAPAKDTSISLPVLQPQAQQQFSPEKHRTAEATGNAGHNIEKPSASGKVHRIEPESERTHTTIEMTKTVTLMVKYVITLPQHNFLVSWISVAIDWLTQFGIFRWVPKRVFGYMIILLALTVLLYFTRELFKQDDGPPVYQLHTICSKCLHREISNIIDPDDEACSKCKSKIGYAWQCTDCGKYFPKLNTEKNIINDPKLSRSEKIVLMKPPVCPFCRSAKVHYVASEDATFGE